MKSISVLMNLGAARHSNPLMIKVDDFEVKNSRDPVRFERRDVEVNDDVLGAIEHKLDFKLDFKLGSTFVFVASPLLVGLARFPSGKHVSHDNFETKCPLIVSTKVIGVNSMSSFSVLGTPLEPIEVNGLVVVEVLVPAHEEEVAIVSLGLNTLAVVNISLSVFVFAERSELVYVGTTIFVELANPDHEEVVIVSPEIFGVNTRTSV